MKVDDIKQELANMENIEDLSPPNEIFYLCGGDSIPLTLCHKIRIGNEFFNYFCEDESRIKEFLSNKSLINKIFYTHKYIAQTPILHVVYNGAPYYIKVEEDNLSVFRKYNIVMHDEPLFDQCRLDVNRLGSWLHIEHTIHNMNVNDILTDMIEGDLFYEDN